MKVKFELNTEANNQEVIDRYDIMEYIALTGDIKILRIIASLVRLQDNTTRRNRTRYERQQRADLYGLDSYKDIIK